jgi:hypothetical protein
MQSLRESFLSRINLAVWIIIVIVLIIALQGTLAAEIKIGNAIPHTVRGLLEVALANQIWLFVKILVLVPIVVFWVLDRRRELRIALLVSLTLLTAELIISILFLCLTLATDTSAVGLIRDTLVVAAINVLVFSLWYWIIDAYPLEDAPPTHIPHDFLFPQYSLTAEKFMNWEAGYFDFLFLAFTTTTAFGPTDTLPLTHRAKLLMLLQALASLIIIVVLASRALSILR